MNLFLLPCFVAAVAGQDGVYPPIPEGPPPKRDLPEAEADSAEHMQPYTERLRGSKEVLLDLVPIPGGTFRMGSPPGEAGREEHEGPAHEVTIAPFWMGRTEVTWDQFDLYTQRLDQEARKRGMLAPEPQDPWTDAVSRPTPPYVPMDFEMGVDGRPAICMTQFAARQFTQWLSWKTGRFYRLPTEAEWEYACRAGTTTAWSFGDDPDLLGEYAWYFDNADDAYHPVGQKKPNPFGLYDMHGNVAEWVLDQLLPYPPAADGPRDNPTVWPTELYPRVVRGGSWDDDAEATRSASRRGSSKGWKVQDPQFPKSIWYHTDATWVGFRVVRPLVEPSEETQQRYWQADLDSIREIQDKQRRGGR